MLQRAARQGAQEALAATFDNFTGQALSNESEENMKRLKAKVNGTWVTGENAQQLVNNAMNCQTNGNCEQTVMAFMEKYLQVFKDNGAIEQNTLVGYKGYLKNHIDPAMGSMHVQEITVDVVQEYVNSKSSQLTAKTIKEHINLMAAAFDGAVEDGLITKNPFRSKRLKIIGKESFLVQAYTEDEYRAFERKVLPNLDESAQLFAALTLYTGMRRGEICALQWEDIDFKRRKINVTKSIAWPSQNRGIIKSPKTSNGIRQPVMIPQLLMILNQYRQEKGFVICGQRPKENEPITRQGIKRLYERIEKAVKDSGMDVDFKSINRRGRHTVATFMNNAELDDKTIESQLGHYDVRFTRQRYMNAQDKQIRRGMDKLVAYMTTL